MSEVRIDITSCDLRDRGMLRFELVVDGKRLDYIRWRSGSDTLRPAVGEPVMQATPELEQAIRDRVTLLLTFYNEGEVDDFIAEMSAQALEDLAVHLERNAAGSN